MRLKRFHKWIATALIITMPTYPMKARADLWGGDIPLLIEIVANTAQQLIKLKKILGTGQDSLKYIRDITNQFISIYT